jgi:hypothetical protein
MDALSDLLCALKISSIFGFQTAELLTGDPVDQQI